MLIDTKTPPPASPKGASAVLPGLAAPTDIPLALDPATARGAYCNVAIVARTDLEFVIDFAFVSPSQKNGVVVSRIIMNPTQAAALHEALGANLSFAARAPETAPAP